MAELSGQPGEVRMTVQVKRKATGKVETYELVGRVEPDKNSKTEDEE